MSFSHVLVTGATGLVGAHVVDNLLKRGIKVKAIARSKTKAEPMLKARPEYASQLHFHYIDDLTTPGVFDEVVQDVDGIIHIASPYKYDFKDNEKELIIPAIKGVQSLLEGSSKSNVKRIVMTSSFGSVLDMAKEEGYPWTYSAKDWNPITYEQAADPKASPQDAYRGSKTIAEQEAWKFIEEKKPQFSLVTLCPSMIFGPTANNLASAAELNESNALLWKVATADPSQALPPCRFNFWIDVRDLAEVHVQALLNPAAGNKRYLPVAPEKFTYSMVSRFVAEEFPWAKGASKETQEVKKDVNVDMEDMKKDFPGIQYKTFKETVTDFVKQVSSLEKSS